MEFVIFDIELPLFGGPGGGANRGRFKFTGLSFGGISPVGGKTSLAPARNKFVKKIVKFLANKKCPKIF